mgnify:CR=1 FL=1
MRATRATSSPPCERIKEYPPSHLGTAVFYFNRLISAQGLPQALARGLKIGLTDVYPVKIVAGHVLREGPRALAAGEERLSALV